MQADQPGNLTHAQDAEMLRPIAKKTLLLPHDRPRHFHKRPISVFNAFDHPIDLIDLFADVFDNLRISRLARYLQIAV